MESWSGGTRGGAGWSADRVCKGSGRCQHGRRSDPEGYQRRWNPSAAMKFDSRDAVTARRIRRPEKLKANRACKFPVVVCRPVCKGEVEPRDTRHKAARNLMMGASSRPRIESTRLSLNDVETGVVFRCDNEPSILGLLRAVKLAWTGDVVQEMSVQG